VQQAARDLPAQDMAGYDVGSGPGRIQRLAARPWT